MVGPQGPTTDWRQSLHRIQRHCCFLFSHGCTGTAHGSSDLLITKFEIEHRRGEFPTSTWLFPSYCELGRLYIRLMHASGMQAWMCMCHNLSEEAFVATCQIKFLLMSIYIYIYNLSVFTLTWPCLLARSPRLPPLRRGNAGGLSSIFLDLHVTM